MARAIARIVPNTTTRFVASPAYAGRANLTRMATRAAAINLVERYADTIRDEFKKYPPERPGQVYVRTFNLRRAWKRQGPFITPLSIFAFSSNDVQDRGGSPYSHYVQGEWQTWFHRGRWLRADKPRDIERRLRLRTQFNSELRLIIRTGMRGIGA